MPALEQLREELDAFKSALKQTGDGWQLHLITIIEHSHQRSAHLSLVELLSAQELLENFATHLMHRVNLQKSTGTLPHNIGSYLEIYHELFHLLYSQSLFACQQHPYAEQDATFQELLQEMIHRAIFSITVNINSNMALINTLNATDSDYDARVLALRTDSINLFLDFFERFPLALDTKVRFFADFSQNTLADLRRGLLTFCPAQIATYQRQNVDAATLSAIGDYERILRFLFPHDSRDQPGYLTAQAFCQQARQALTIKTGAQEALNASTPVVGNSDTLSVKPALRYRAALEKLKPVTALTTWENTVTEVNRSLESCIEVFDLKDIATEFNRLDSCINELERDYYLLVQFSVTPLGPEIQKKYFFVRSALLSVLFEQGLLIFKKYPFSRQTAPDRALLMLVIQAVLRATIHHLQLCDGCSGSLFIGSTREENSHHFYQKGVQVFIDFLNGFPFEGDPADLLMMFSKVNSGKGAFALQKKLFYFCEQRLSWQVAIAERQIPLSLAQHDEEVATILLVAAKKALNDFLRIIAIYSHEQQDACFSAMRECKKQETRLDTLSQHIATSQAAPAASKKKKYRANQKLKKHHEKYTLLDHQLQLLIMNFQQFHTQTDITSAAAQQRLANNADTFYSLLGQSEVLFLTASDAGSTLAYTPLQALSQQLIATVIIVINLCYGRIQSLSASTPDCPDVQYFSDYALRLFLQCAIFFDKPHFDAFFAKVAGSSLTQQLHALFLEASLFEFCERQLIRFLKEDDLPAARVIYNHYVQILALFKPYEHDQAMAITPAYAYGPSWQRVQAWGTSLQERELLKSFPSAPVKPVTAPKTHKKKSTQRSKSVTSSKTNTQQTATVVTPPVVTTKTSGKAITIESVSSTESLPEATKLTSGDASTSVPVIVVLPPLVTTKASAKAITIEPVNATESDATNLNHSLITTPTTRATLTSSPVELPIVESLNVDDTTTLTANLPEIATNTPTLSEQALLARSTQIYQQLLNDFPHLEEPRYLAALTRICLLLDQHPAIELFVYGSIRHKKRPNDIDLLVLCDEPSSVDAFFRDLAKEGLAKIAYQKRKAAFHYDARVFDIGGIKIEFIKPLSAGFTLENHCAVLDFTISAWHYHLRRLCVITYALATEHLARRQLTAMIDAETLFRRDPSIIFRAVRLIATEGYHLDPADFKVLQNIFARENIFMGMDCHKLHDEYIALFYTGHARSNLLVLQDLQLLTHLFPVILFLSPWQQQITLHLLHDVAALIDARMPHEPINHWLMYSAAHAFFASPTALINPALFLPHIGLVWNGSAALLATMDAPNKAYLNQKIHDFAMKMPPPFLLPACAHTTGMPSMQVNTTFHSNNTAAQPTALSGTTTRQPRRVNTNIGTVYDQLPAHTHQRMSKR